MTRLEKAQTEFQTLNDAYRLLYEGGASNSLLIEALDHVNIFHAIYMNELRRTIADAVAAEEVSA